MQSSLSAIAAFLSWLTILLCSLLVAKLFKYRLEAKYRYFSFYLIINVIGILCAQLIAWSNEHYFEFWVLFQTVSWTLAAMMVIELHQLILVEYPGLKTTGKGLLIGAIFLAMTVSIATIGIDFPNTVFSQKTMAVAALVHRVILFNLLVFLLVTLVGLSWFPIQLTRNLKLHASLLFFLFFGEGLTNLFRNSVGAGRDDVLAVIWAFFNAVLLTVWLWKLTVQGESLSSTSTVRVLSGKEQMLLLQMRALDQALQRSLRK